MLVSELVLLLHMKQDIGETLWGEQGILCISEVYSVVRL